VFPASWAHRALCLLCVLPPPWPLADAVPRAQEQIKATMLIASDIEAFVKTTLGV
jgi:hypothetical protein